MPSKNFKFTEVPTTSAADIFQYEIIPITKEQTNEDILFERRNVKSVNENRLYFQSSNKLNATLPDNQPIKDAVQTDQEECYPVSGQSVNSSGILNEIVDGVSLSNVEVSSDKESVNEEY